MSHLLSQPRVRHQLDAIAAACATAAGPAFLDDIAGRLRRIVPFDGAFISATDPVTTLSTSPALIENISTASCVPYWESEFLTEDVLRFTDLVGAPRPVATLHDVTGGHPARSARHRAVNVPNGFGDELRAALRLGDALWGAMVLYRAADAPVFSSADQDVVADLSETLATGFRRLAVTEPSPMQGGGPPPGVLLFDPDGTLLAANESVQAWLSELHPSTPVTVEHGLVVPTEVFTVVNRARAIAAGRSGGSARARILGRAGRWLVAHATVLASAGDPGRGQIAVVIEPANPSEVVPIIVEAFGLTSREREITVCVARGLDTGEIAATLFLSPHTVRDHLKSVFEKVGVSSRGELVARIFSTVNDIGAHVA